MLRLSQVSGAGVVPGGSGGGGAGAVLVVVGKAAGVVALAAREVV